MTLSATVQNSIISVVCLLAIASVFLDGSPHQSTANVRTRDLQEQQQRQMQHTSQYNRDLSFGRNSLRVAAFGSSNTWGAGLDNRFEAYPYLLSPEVDNFASFSAGPNYASVCTQTLVGDDEMYDVILLEFWLRAYEGLEELTRRLRGRFPLAVMIFIKLSGPLHVRRKDTKDSPEPGLNLAQWKVKQDIPLGQVNALIEAIRADTGYWYFPPHTEADTVVNKAARASNGFQFGLPLLDNDKDTLMNYLRFYDSQHHALLNELGHEVIGNITKDIYEAHIPLSTPDFVDSATRTGNWGFGDKCDVWLGTGGCNYDYSPGLVMTEFDTKRGKFALEVREAGWLNLRNPFDEPRALYVSFMAHNSTEYPEVELSYNNFTQILNPISSFDHNNAGVTRTVPAGMIPPGNWKIKFAPLINRQWNSPFQLLGMTFTSKTVVPMEYGFGPEYNQ